jgi:hypothetical protein
MPQCQGTTKAGERCKRDANQDSDFCGFHGEPAADGSSDETSSSDTEDRGTDLLLIGVVAVGLFALKRLLRFL